jgi:hypothetical protein
MMPPIGAPDAVTQAREKPMNLRKTIILAAAAAAAGALALTPSVQAASPTGADITVINVGGNATAGVVPFDGIFKGGTIIFNTLGFTSSCTAGTIGGSVNRGPFASGGTAFNVTTLTLSCATPLGIKATIALGPPPACIAPMAMGDVKQAPLNDNVHVGLTDTGFWTAGGAKPKFHNVVGFMVVPLKCVTFTLTGGSTCTARADGTVQAQFNEATKVVNGVTYQDLILNGVGLTLRNQTASCLGVMAGGVTLNQITFNVKPTGTPGPIDFQ